MGQFKKFENYEEYEQRFCRRCIFFQVHSKLGESGCETCPVMELHGDGAKWQARETFIPTGRKKQNMQCRMFVPATDEQREQLVTGLKAARQQDDRDRKALSTKAGRPVNP